jgi:hypothetical protein
MTSGTNEPRVRVYHRTPARVFHRGLVSNEICNHDVVRISATRIYSRAWCKRADEGPIESFPREKLERGGVWRTGCLYLFMPASEFLVFDSGWTASSAVSRPAWCDALGVEWPCTSDEIRAAWRRVARTTHPDAGGSPEQFIEARRAYEQALASLEQRKVA